MEAISSVRNQNLVTTKKIRELVTKLELKISKIWSLKYLII